jgi:cystathionine gamma-lyase
VRNQWKDQHEQSRSTVQFRQRSAGLTFSFADLSNLAAIAPLIRPETRMIWVESPTNPMLTLVDLAAVARVAKANNLLLVVDNTFASPYLQRPLEYGAAIVVHSATKYLNGHSDVVGGAVVVDDNELAERIGYLQNAVGAIAGPFDSFLASRRIIEASPPRAAENTLVIAAHPWTNTDCCRLSISLPQKAVKNTMESVTIFNH